MQQKIGVEEEENFIIFIFLTQTPAETLSINRYLYLYKRVNITTEAYKTQNIFIPKNFIYICTQQLHAR